MRRFDLAAMRCTMTTRTFAIPSARRQGIGRHADRY